jgi:hypothetical protein
MASAGDIFGSARPSVYLSGLLDATSIGLDVALIAIRTG